MVLLPVVLGMILNAKVPRLSKTLSCVTPFASILLVSLTHSGVVSQNVLALGVTSSDVLPKVVGSVVFLHLIGFLAGFLVQKRVLHFSEQTSWTISIEKGMQNSALAVVLAQSLGAPDITSLPGAFSATVHFYLRSILAAYWRVRASNQNSFTNMGKEEMENS